MWLIASAFLVHPPAPAPSVDLSTCDNGTLPEQVVGVATNPMQVFLLAPGWGDPRFQSRCEQLHPTADCDPARFVYPSLETVGEARDVTGTSLRYSVVLQPDAPLEGRIEGFRSGGQAFSVGFDLTTGDLDLRTPAERHREQLLRTGFVTGLVTEAAAGPGDDGSGGRDQPASRSTTSARPSTP